MTTSRLTLIRGSSFDGPIETVMVALFSETVASVGDLAVFNGNAGSS